MINTWLSFLAEHQTVVAEVHPQMCKIGKFPVQHMEGENVLLKCKQ